MHHFKGGGIIFHLSTFIMGNTCFQLKAILPGSLAIRREIVCSCERLSPPVAAHWVSVILLWHWGWISEKTACRLLTAGSCEKPSESTTDSDRASNWPFPLWILLFLVSQHWSWKPTILKYHTQKDCKNSKQETEKWEIHSFFFFSFKEKSPELCL